MAVDQVAALGMSAHHHCGMGSHARLMSRDTALFSAFSRRWVLSVDRRLAFTLEFQERDGTDPVCARNVHVFIVMSATLGVIDCGVFAINGENRATLVGCINWASVSPLVTPSTSRSVTTGILRIEDRHLFAALLTDTKPGNEVSIVDSRGEHLRHNVMVNVERWPIILANTKWMVYSTFRNILFYHIDPEVFGYLSEYHRLVTGSSSIHCGSFHRFNENVLVLIRGDGHGPTKIVQIDLLSSYAQNRTVVLSETTGLPDREYMDFMWCGGSLCTLSRDHQGQEVTLFNTETTALTSFPAWNVFPTGPGDTLCITTKPPCGTCTTYHVSDLSKPLCTLPATHVRKQCANAGIIPLPVETDTPGKTVVALHDSLTGSVIATVTAPQSYSLLS